ncbi:MAG TPA: hypothetical protein VFH54_06095 [Mycobacteriales bacterium]|nr:hypothetical protein [Mycobacteriales bacterium]
MPPRKTTKAPAKPRLRSPKPPATDPTVPSRLGERGTRLWLELHPDGVTRDPATDALIEEACRLTDRLDRLDLLIRGQVDDWLRVTLPAGDGTELLLVVNPLLAEARQHATALRGLLAPVLKAPIEKPKQETSLADQLAARRAARRTDTTAAKRPSRAK